MIRKLLIANRGEIAVRIIRTCRELRVRTVAVYSEPDERAMHTLLADESLPIGASEPSASYLDISKIIEAAKRAGADAIHPGYGFLSERSEFADACVQAGLIFVGPSGAAMRALGSKIAAKQLAVKTGVPVTPGYFEAGADASTLAAAADRIGYPIMLKASAGGGGRGMRIVRDPSAFAEELEIASTEALNAFGDGAMMVEKLVERPRHIEAQVLADNHGTVATLFERECSIQRRHQKLIEEAPSPVLPLEVWGELREAARSLILAAGYVGAGTVEFIYDEAARSFYFLEVNARLQVEHPVTEAITGLDLVAWQLRIASGERLQIDPALVEGRRNAINGHSIEARIVAEDPSRGFLPSVGALIGWSVPNVPGVRIDSGFQSGAEVSRYYDSLLAKVIVHAQDRVSAIRKLEVALEEFHVLGVKTNIAYLLEVLRHSDFQAGRFDTGFLEREFGDYAPSIDLPPFLANLLSQAAESEAAPSQIASTAWQPDGWRIFR